MEHGRLKTMDGQYPDAELFFTLEKKQSRERARYRAKAPRKAGVLAADALRRHGYDRLEAPQSFAHLWRRVLVEAGVPRRLQDGCRTGRVRRGVLEVWVSHSVMNQELMFHARNIVEILRKCAPDERIRALRIRVGNENNG